MEKTDSIDETCGGLFSSIVNHPGFTKMESLKSEASPSESLDSNDIDSEFPFDRQIHDKENDVPNFRPISKSVPINYQSKAPTYTTPKYVHSL